MAQFNYKLPSWLLVKIAEDSDDVFMEFVLEPVQESSSQGYGGYKSKASYNVFAYVNGFFSGVNNPEAWAAFCKAVELHCTTVITMPPGEVLVDSTGKTIARMTDNGIEWLEGPLSDKYQSNDAAIPEAEATNPAVNGPMTPKVRPEPVRPQPKPGPVRPQPKQRDRTS